jgi:hypothetical protein
MGVVKCLSDFEPTGCQCASAGAGLTTLIVTDEDELNAAKIEDVLVGA